MQLAMHMVTIEDLMPREHFLRKLEAVLDLSFVYEETAPLYSKKYGRPAIDPVVIVKYLLVGFLYGIPSERQIERRVQTDIDRQAEEMFLRLVKQMVETEDITEQLKADNQMEWVGRMNNIRRRATEVVNKDIIYN